MKRFNRDESKKFQPKRFDRKSPSRFDEEDRFSRREDRPFDKKLFPVTCAKCGDRCEVPFKPTGDKPVYCSNCFRKNDRFESKSLGSNTNDFDEIHRKLDKIMDALDIK